MKEIAIMKKLDHPNVIRLHEVLYGDEKNKLYLVLDFAEKGQLIEWNEDDNIFVYTEEREKPFLEESELRKIFQDCILGLYYLHINNIIHRDLKPQNILFDANGVAKLADFGVSELFDKTDSINDCEGTYHFMAPELFNLQEKMSFKGKLADIWGLGVTFFSFIFLEVPFLGNNLLEMADKIKNETLKFPAKRKISPELQDLLKKMLEKDPEKRITLDEIIQNKWLNQEGLNLPEVM